MPPRSSPARSVLSLLAACLTLGIAGCGTDDVQFNGGIFDAVGLSDNTKSKSGDPKLAERAPLVVPPSLDRLPPPGEVAPPTQIADIKDPDAQKAVTRAELEAKQAEYCKVNYEDAKARGDDSAASAEGPLGPCRPSVLSSFKKWNGGDEVEGQ
jgi:hypothetical protein